MPTPFLHGLVLHPSRFSITSLTGTRKKVAGTLHWVQSTSQEKDNATRNSDAWLAKHRKNLRGEIHAAIPAESALLHVADFPGSDPDELDGMVALRAEDLSPFPMDRTYIGWEILSASEAESRVLIVLAAHNVVDSLHDSLRAHHLTPHRVDVDLLGRWHLIALNEADDLRSRLLLVFDADQSHLLALDQGVPVAFIPLGDLRDLSPDLLIEDLNLALAGIEAERGALDFEELTLWAPDELSYSLPIDLLTAHLGFPVQPRDLNALPPVSEGVARRGLNSSPAAPLDLSPPEWKEEEASRVLRKRLARAGVLAAALWLLLTGGLMTHVRLQDNRLRDLRHQFTQQEQDVRHVRDLARQVRSLTQFTQRDTSVLEVLRLMAEATPRNGDLLVTDFQYRKDQGVTFNGDIRGDFFQFQEALSAANILHIEDFDTQESRGRTEFRVNARWAWQNDQPEPSP